MKIILLLSIQLTKTSSLPGALCVPVGCDYLSTVNTGLAK
jgi:hypothetical protein